MCVCVCVLLWVAEEGLFNMFTNKTIHHLAVIDTVDGGVGALRTAFDMNSGEVKMTE